MIITNSLTLYRHQAALVLQVTAKHLMIQLEHGNAKKVRHKDVVLLHKGPVKQWPLPAYNNVSVDDLLEAWELLQGSSTSLAEVCELLYSETSPTQAWHVWQWIETQAYFTGSPDKLQAQRQETVQAIIVAEKRKHDAKQLWSALLQRIKNSSLLPEDADAMLDVEMLANHQRTKSRILQALDISQTAQEAHRLLLRCGHWSAAHNPWPVRHAITLKPAMCLWPDLPDETRMDLTHLPAFAIDDVGNQDPDDAISIDIDIDKAIYWIHIADVAAIVQPHSDLDNEAHARAATLYLPECTVPMLPAAAVQQLGLGLQSVSPALSIAVKLNNDGSIADCHVHSSYVRVQRLNYTEVSAYIQQQQQQPFFQLWQISQQRQQYRLARSALQLDFPEVRIRVVDDVVTIKALPAEISRSMVSEWMLMAGEAVAWLAAKEGFALPHSWQHADLPTQEPTTLAEMYTCRQKLLPSSRSAIAEPHAALGLPAYVQCTSPLRRYGDLLAHQQLRAWLAGRSLQSSNDIDKRLAEYSETAKAVRYCERRSNMHWTIYYLQQQPQWSGEGIVLEQRGRKIRVSIASLGLEVWLNAKGQYIADTKLLLTQAKVLLPEASVRFKIAYQNA